MTEKQIDSPLPKFEHWVMYFKSSLTLNGTGSGVVLISPQENKLKYALRLHSKATNNVMEYEALVNGLRIAAELGVRPLYVWGDSELVVNQVMKESACPYCKEVRKLEAKFEGLKLHHVLRRDNE